MPQQHHTNLHTEQQTRSSLAPHGLYCSATAALHVRLHAGSDGAPSEVAAYGALYGDGCEHDREHVAQATARCMTAPVALQAV